jgi:hypothetical protein
MKLLVLNIQQFKSLPLLFCFISGGTPRILLSRQHEIAFLIKYHHPINNFTFIVLAKPQPQQVMRAVTYISTSVAI